MIKNTDYPITRRDASVVDDFHGVKVADPYRWLEDPDAEETQRFVEAQNKLTKPFLEQCDKRKEINDRLTELWNYPKYGCVSKRGDFYYYFMNTGLQNQNVLYQTDSLDGKPTVFFDPNELSDDGTVAMGLSEFSPDCNLFAYTLSENGSDWTTIKVRDVKTGKDLPDVLDRTKFSSITWTSNSKGFFYCRYPEEFETADGCETEQLEQQRLYYHRIGQDQNKDVLVVEFEDNPSWRIITEVSNCGKYLIVYSVETCSDSHLYFAEIENPSNIQGQLQLTQIVGDFEADYSYVTNNGSKVIFFTNRDAPNYKVVEIDFNNPAIENWKTLIKEHPTDVLVSIVCADSDKLVLTYTRDVKSIIQVNSLHNGEYLFKFDIDIGTVNIVFGERKYSEIFFQFDSFLTPGIVYHYNFASGHKKLQTIFESTLPSLNSRDYIIKQIFYSSKDGTKIPMFIIQKRGSQINVPRPCLMCGYGGFNISLTPAFDIMNIMFVDTFDGVLAVPNIRGGGEYGKHWHDGGRLLNKQNVFDDFQAAAEYLIQNKYTTSSQLAIQGSSNGGLLIGACITQRPELFGAAVAHCGVLDMLRFHKFTIGYAWMCDYGNPDEEEHFQNLYKFSPVHNAKTPTSFEKQFPSTLILTADHDDRVSSLHSLKFGAALQNAVRGCLYQKNPILLNVDTNAGHGAGKPTDKEIEENTDILVFLYKTLNI